MTGRYIAIRANIDPSELESKLHVEECVGHEVNGFHVGESGKCPANNGQAYLPVRQVLPRAGAETEFMQIVEELRDSGKVYLF